MKTGTPLLAGPQVKENHADACHPDRLYWHHFVQTHSLINEKSFYWNGQLTVNSVR
ncbi:hypothetical protein FC82_GL003302 [Secundilactobacillus collinoides DSM 20515 = JCM 1123]|uniref:Uncharacterized protein n=1 Tax=Secundilactobacillus collinoides DSM 20515 = JCM 1123 TaxID=1423733 RepID=A0A0R2B637_SECCO|nr:hypothetical protein FC82_GL003302 [Secundilactobacillus collinoides DSM 20515 = JCM 1123]